MTSPLLHHGRFKSGIQWKKLMSLPLAKKGSHCVKAIAASPRPCCMLGLSPVPLLPQLWRLLCAHSNYFATPASDAPIKSLCDLHGVPFRPYLTKQFSICFDVYLSIRQEVDSRVQAALRREAANWRLQHACPACTHKLEGEPELEFALLFCMDGNNSAKRIPRRAPGVQRPEDDDIAVGDNNERPDSRKVEGDYYLSRKRVDRWDKEVIHKLLLEPGFEVRLRPEGLLYWANTHRHHRLQMAMTSPSSARIVGRTWPRSLLLECGAFLTRQAYFWRSVDMDLFWLSWTWCRAGSCKFSTALCPILSN